MDKIISTLNSINSTSKKLLYFACFFAASSCIVGISVIIYNNSFLNIVNLYEFGAKLIQKACSSFAILVICALFMDWFKNVFFNDD